MKWQYLSAPWLDFSHAADVPHQSASLLAFPYIELSALLVAEYRSQKSLEDKQFIRFTNLALHFLTLL